MRVHNLARVQRKGPGRGIHSDVTEDLSYQWELYCLPYLRVPRTAFKQVFPVREHPYPALSNHSQDFYNDFFELDRFIKL